MVKRKSRPQTTIMLAVKTVVGMSKQTVIGSNPIGRTKSFMLGSHKKTKQMEDWQSGRLHLT